MVPTLSQIQAYDPQHLMSAGAHWDETAQRWEDTLGEFFTSAMFLDFHGKTAETMRDSVARQRQGAFTDADKLRQAAAIASNAADMLRQAKQRVLNLAEHAVNNGFSVSDTYQVADISGSSRDAAARAAAAQEMSADMTRYAGELWAADARTAGDMIQAVDFKTDGGIDSQQCRDAVHQAEQDREHMAEWAAGMGFITGAMAGGPLAGAAGMAGMGALGSLWYQYTHKTLPGACQ